MTVLNDTEILEVCEKAGFTGDSLVTAACIALAESGGKSDARNYNPPTSDMPDGSIDRGLFQINSLFHPEVSQQCADTPLCAADKAYQISNKGTNFSPWVTFTSGSYKEYENRIKQAVATMQHASPAHSPAPEPHGNDEPITTPRHYHVRSGDTLWGIADMFYHNGEKWHLIYKANKHIIGNDPNELQVNEVLHIPRVKE